MRKFMDNYFRYFKKLGLVLKISVCGLVLPVIITSPAHAAGENAEIPWYEVEVIIFANTQKTAGNTETWPENVVTAGYDHVLDLALPGFTPLKPNLPPVNTQASLKPVSLNEGNVYANGAYVLLNKDFFQLNSIADRINSSSQYDVVLHLAWRQPTFDEDKSLPVFVFNGMLERDPAPEPISNPGLNQGYDFYVNGLEAGPQYYWLSGTLKLSVSRYLHLESDLHMKLRTTKQEVIEQSPPPEAGGFGSFFGMAKEPTPIMIERPVLQDYRLYETRRMRSKEIHYFDHPMMGIVVKVTPYEFDVPNPEPATPKPQ
jgi:hypothetical protein